MSKEAHTGRSLFKNRSVEGTQKRSSFVDRPLFCGGIWRIAGGWDETIIPGKMDKAAREVYSHGQCAYLALAIHEQTGGQIWAIVSLHDSSGGESRPEKIFDSAAGDFYEGMAPDHFGTERNGMIIDICGADTRKCWESRCGGYAVKVTPGQVRLWQEHHQRTMLWMGRDPGAFDEDSLWLARTFADVLLKNQGSRYAHGALPSR